jgi:hypothetical protein
MGVGGRWVFLASNNFKEEENEQVNQMAKKQSESGKSV